MNLNDLHPMLVHFPIALALVALLADLASYYFKQSCWLNKAAVALTVLAALGAWASLTSGFMFTKPTAGMAEIIKLVHIKYAVTTTIILSFAALIGLFAMLKYSYKNAPLRYSVTVLLIAAAVFVSLTGMKGGSIVYDVWLKF